MTKRRFYRATLASIVWNPKTDKPLAKFVDGQFITEDEEVAQTLTDMGYPEVSLDATHPPEIIAAPVPIITPDAHPAKTEEQDLALTKRKSSGSPPIAEAQGEDKPPKDKPKRVIKRRDR